MKVLFSLLMGIQMMGMVAQAQAVASQEVVLEVLKSSKRTINFTVEKDSFNWNIQGYACPWPGLNISRNDLDMDLNHQGGYSMGAGDNKIAIGIKNPNFGFCGMPPAEKVFGPEFVEGAIFFMSIESELAFVRLPWADDKRVLREVITITVNGRKLETKAYVTSLKQ